MIDKKAEGTKPKPRRHTQMGIPMGGSILNPKIAINLHLSKKDNLTTVIQKIHDAKREITNEIVSKNYSPIGSICLYLYNEQTALYEYHGLDKLSKINLKNIEENPAFLVCRL